MKKNIADLVAEINDRFDEFLVSEEKAYATVGKKTAKQIAIENSEQFDSRRALLNVEEDTNKKREQELQQKERLKAKVESEFHEDVAEELQKRLSDTDDIMTSVLDIGTNIGKLMDVLYTDACTISRLVTQIEEMPWLSKRLIQFTHQPKYQRTDASGSAIMIKSLRQALSFIGIESLRTLIPVLIAKHTLPKKSEAFKDLNKHLWIYTLGTGNVAKCLAPRLGARAEFGFIAGLLSAMGTSSVVTQYMKVFDSKQREAIIQCRNSNAMPKAETLNQLTYSAEYLAAYIRLYAGKVSSDIISKFNMRWIMISPGFSDWSKVRNETFKQIQKKELHPIALLLFKSQSFMKFKLLQSSRLISKQESMIWLHNCGINGDDISILSLINLTGISFEIAEEIVSVEE